MKLSANKTGKITIWRGDDPMELASSFARIYSLDLKARDLLVNVICQSMEQNGLIVLSAADYDAAANQHDGHTGSHFTFPPETVDHSHRYHFSDNQHVAYAQGTAAAATTAVEEEDSFSGSSVSGSQDIGDGDEEGEGEGEDGEEEDDVEEEGQSDNSVDRSVGSGTEEEES